jgi:D-psicose/D-tagatose/L-ribulose 3-epimerase
MKLSVSNIAWDIENESKVLGILERYGVSGVEIAPTKIWPEWQGITTDSVNEYCKKLYSKGFSISALQAIMYGKPELNIFEEKSHAKFLEHLGLVSELSASLGTDKLVFGAPVNRTRLTLAEEEIDLALKFFRKASNVCFNNGCVLLIENVPEVYGCNFLTSSREVIDFVELVDEPGVGIHVDSGGVSLEGWNPDSDLFDGLDLQHFHISEPGLAAVGPDKVDYRGMFQQLKNMGYLGWVSVEMKRPDNIIILEQSISYIADLLDGFYA